jgi:long-chain fatty acid transport protein
MRKAVFVLTGLALLAVVSSAGAQGFGVYEQGACAMGRGGATVAQPCSDGSSIFFNPAAIAFTTGTQISVGGTLINPRGDFNPDAGTKGSLLNRYYPVPSIYAVHSFGKVSFGAGFFAPYGLTTDWPRNFEGRFLGYKTSVKGIYVQPTVALKVSDRFSIGGGLDLVYAAIELNQRVDLSSQLLAPGVTFAAVGVPVRTDFADVRLSGNGMQLGYHLGMLVKANDRVSIGARYLSRERVDLSGGKFTTTQIPTGLVTAGPLSAQIPAGTPYDTIVAPQFLSPNSLFGGQYADTVITFPDAFVIGLAIKAAPKTTVLVDYQYTHWALFDTLIVTKAYPTTPPGANVITMVENYKDTHGIRLGLEHELNAKSILRAGFVKNTAAAPDETVTPLLPEGARMQFTGGFGYKVSKHLTADVFYMYLAQSDRRGRTVSGTAANNNGTFSFMSHLFGITLTAGF